MEQIQTCIRRGHRSEDSLWDFISLHWKHFFPHCHIHTHFTRDFSVPFGAGSDSLISLPFSVCEHSTPVNSFLLLLHLRWADIQPVCMLMIMLFVNSQSCILVKANDLGIVNMLCISFDKKSALDKFTSNVSKFNSLIREAAR